MVLSDTSVHACPLAGGEAPEGDKAGGGGFVEGAVGVVGGELLAVEGEGGCAPHHGTRTLVELEADGAGYGLLGLVYEGIEGGLEGREPEAVVGELGVALLGEGLKAEHVLGKGEGFELSVSLDDGEGGGGFVDLAALYPHQTVLYHIHPAYAVRAGELVEPGDELHQRDRKSTRLNSS